MGKRKNYTEPELEIVLFDSFGKSADIITSSGYNEPGELDPDAWD